MEDAINRAIAAAHPHPAVKPHVERAVALATFQAHEQSGPFRHEPLSSGVPQRPKHPCLPALHEVRGDALADALEALQVELVWAADCAEFTDATANAQQYLRAAGHVDLAAQAALALAGPGLGLVLMPPERVWGLAAGLGRQVSDLIAEGERSMGVLPASPTRDADYHASYRWDMHHEAPVSSAADLGPRQLIEYSVRFASGRARCEAALGEPTPVRRHPSSSTPPTPTRSRSSGTPRRPNGRCRRSTTTSTDSPRGSAPGRSITSSSGRRCRRSSSRAPSARPTRSPAPSTCT